MRHKNGTRTSSDLILNFRGESLRIYSFRSSSNPGQDMIGTFRMTLLPVYRPSLRS
jgi:hypothetical protein